MSGTCLGVVETKMASRGGPLCQGATHVLGKLVTESGGVFKYMWKHQIKEIQYTMDAPWENVVSAVLETQGWHSKSSLCIINHSNKG